MTRTAQFPLVTRPLTGGGLGDFMACPPVRWGTAWAGQLEFKISPGLFHQGGPARAAWQSCAVVWTLVIPKLFLGYFGLVTRTAVSQAAAVRFNLPGFITGLFGKVSPHENDGENANGAAAFKATAPPSLIILMR